MKSINFFAGVSGGIGGGGEGVIGGNGTTNGTAGGDQEGSAVIQIPGQGNENVVVPGQGEVIVPTTLEPPEFGVQIDTSQERGRQSESQVSGPDDSKIPERVPERRPMRTGPQPERPAGPGGNRGQGRQPIAPAGNRGRELRPPFEFGGRPSADLCNCFVSQRCPSQSQINRQIALYNGPCQACIFLSCGE